MSIERIIRGAAISLVALFLVAGGAMASNGWQSGHVGPANDPGTTPTIGAPASTQSQVSSAPATAGPRQPGNPQTTAQPHPTDRPGANSQPWGNCHVTHSDSHMNGWHQDGYYHDGWDNCR